MRKIEESTSLMSCPVLKESGGSGPPPSPVEMYMKPSRPKRMHPPLCPPDFQEKINCSDCKSARGGLVSSTRKREMRVPSASSGLRIYQMYTKWLLVNCG